MKMQDELPCFTPSLNEMTIVHSKMAPIQVMHSMCESTKESSSNWTVGDPDWHNSLGRPGLPSESVWHPLKSY